MARSTAPNKPSKINPSQFKHRVLIEEEPCVSDGRGGFVDGDWTTFKKRWAKIETLTAGQRRFAGKNEENVDTKITMYYTSGVTVAMRITHAGLIYQIQGIDNLEENNVWLVLNCMKGVAS